MGTPLLSPISPCIMCLPVSVPCLDPNCSPRGSVWGLLESTRRRSATPCDAALPPSPCRNFSRAARRAAIRKVLPRIAKFADIRTDPGSLQVQRFGDLPVPASLPPEPHKQSVAFGFGRTLPRQEFRRRKRADMPARHPGEQLGEADLQGARQPDHREDPEVASATLEIGKIAPGDRYPAAGGLLGVVSLPTAAQAP